MVYFLEKIFKDFIQSFSFRLVRKGGIYSPQTALDIIIKSGYIKNYQNLNIK